MKILGIVLIVLGILALAYRGITYHEKETVLNIGPIHAEEERAHTFPIPPLIGAAAIAGGVALLVFGARKP